MTNDFDFNTCEIYCLNYLFLTFYYLRTVYYSKFKMMFLDRSPFTRCVLRFPVDEGSMSSEIFKFSYFVHGYNLLLRLL